MYNRLVDFSLDRPGHEALRAAYLDNAVVVTPNPHVHALYADKRNLGLLSDKAALRGWGLSPAMARRSSGVPHTVVVTSDNAAATVGEKEDAVLQAGQADTAARVSIAATR